MRTICFLIALLWTAFATEAANVTFNLSDILQTTQPLQKKTVVVTPQSTPRTNATNTIVISEPRYFNLGTNASFTATNLVYGNYLISVWSLNSTSQFRILVPDTNSALYASDLIVTTNSVPSESAGYTQTAANRRFVLRNDGWASNLVVTNLVMPSGASDGYVWTASGSTGAGAWAPGGGGGGGGGLSTVRTNGTSISGAATSLNLVEGTNVIFRATNSAGAVTVQINAVAGSGSANLETNANQFGASTTLTIKDGPQFTNVITRGLTNTGAFSNSGAAYIGGVLSADSLATDFISQGPGGVVSIGDTAVTGPLTAATNATISGTNDSKWIKLSGGQAASSLLRLDAGTNVTTATATNGLAFDGTNISYIGGAQRPTFEIYDGFDRYIPVNTGLIGTSDSGYAWGIRGNSTNAVTTTRGRNGWRLSYGSNAPGEFYVWATNTAQFVPTTNWTKVEAQVSFENTGINNGLADLVTILFTDNHNLSGNFLHVVLGYNRFYVEKSVTGTKYIDRAIYLDPSDGNSNRVWQYSITVVSNTFTAQIGPWNCTFSADDLYLYAAKPVVLLEIAGSATNNIRGYIEDIKIGYAAPMENTFLRNVRFSTNNTIDRISTATNNAGVVHLTGGTAASSLLRTDSGTNLAAVTIGANLSFDGTTLSASVSGSIGAGALEFNLNQFATNSNVSIKNGALLTNMQARGVTDLNVTASRVAAFNASGNLTNSQGVDLTELEYLDGVTSAIQTQFTGKQNGQTNANQFGASTTLTIANGALLTNISSRGVTIPILTTDRALAINASGNITNSQNVTIAELEFLDGVTSAIQTQLNSKQNGATNTTQFGASTTLTLKPAPIITNLQPHIVTQNITGTGGANTNFTLLATNAETTINGFTNVSIRAVMAYVDGVSLYWTCLITNGSGSDRTLEFSAVTNRYRFSGTYGTNAPSVLTNNTQLLISGRSLGTNTLIGYTYYAWP